MNDPCQQHDDLREAVHEFIVAGANNALTEEMWAKFEQLLRDNDEACRLYAEYVELSVLLPSVLSSVPDEDASSGFHALDIQSAQPMQPAVADSLWQGAFSYLSQVGPLSYLVASLLFAVGLFIGSQVTVDRQANQATTHHSVTLPYVATVTDMVGCRWKQLGQGLVVRGHGTETSNITSEHPDQHVRVSLGDRFILSSGLMEITYDTGAKVILQSPCTYDVETAHGGYLAVGRLTARVENQDVGDGRRSVAGETEPREIDFGSLIADRRPLPALFSIRTPTAIVTDLGTEFGVEVEESGTTRSYVFQGKIELRPQDGRQEFAAGEQPVVQLTQNESACVERGRNRKVAIRRTPVQPERFMRRIPASGIAQPSSRGRPSTSSGLRPWTLVDLGTLGGSSSYGWGINDRGQVVGYSTTAVGAEHAFLYTDGKMTDLGTLGGSVSRAFAVNDRGQVIGKAATRDGAMHAFLHDHGQMIDLGTLGGKVSSAADINNRGQVVGYAQTAAGVNHAFLFGNGVMKDLGTFGGRRSSANGINDHGHVAGCFFDREDVPHAYLWNGSDVALLGSLGGKGSVAMQVDDAGRVVGHAAVSGDTACRAFVQSDGKIKALGSPQGGSSEAYRISENGLAVGRDEPANNNSSMSRFTHACLFDTRTGTAFDLNSLIDPGEAWLLVHATDVNRKGMIVGYGTASDGGTRAFLLIPNH